MGNLKRDRYTNKELASSDSALELRTRLQVNAGIDRDQFRAELEAKTAQAEAWREAAELQGSQHQAPEQCVRGCTGEEDGKCRCGYFTAVTATTKARALDNVTEDVSGSQE